jgi:hypothetical protein
VHHLRRRINSKHASLLLVSLLLIAIITVGIGFYVSKHASMAIITLETLTPTSLQAAVDQASASGGGEVVIPSGTMYFNDETITIPGGVNVTGAGVANTFLVQTKSSPFKTMFEVNANNGKSVRISGIEFHGLVSSLAGDIVGGGKGISVSYGIDFRIDHCKFTDFPSGAITVGSPYVNNIARGVIDHNIIDNPYKDVYPTAIWGYGIVVSGHYATWNSDITKYLGKYIVPSNALVYIEDNNFSRCRHAIASNQAAWYVARYNTISEARQKNYGQIDVHGSSGATTAGGRGAEMYNNVITAPAGWEAYTAGLLYRGGGGVAYSNTFNFPNSLQHAIYLGRDSTIAEYQVHDLYLWNNNVNGPAGLLQNNVGYIENVDYFLHEPNQASDGFSYTPYTYPHPLVSGNPYIPPEPTSSPSPTPYGQTPNPYATSPPNITPAFTPPPPPEPTGLWLVDGWNNFWYWVRWSVFRWWH